MAQEGDSSVADLAACAASQALLVDHLRSLRGVRPDSPSKLDGWTVGHVLTHLARNADSYRSLVAGGPQYEGGWQERNEDIDKGAHRDWATLVDDVSTACAQLVAAFEEIADWDRAVPMLMGAQPVRFLPRARQREVEVHRVDLGLGYEVDDVPTDFVARDLALLRRWWIAIAEGSTDLPTPVTSLPVMEQWMWLLGRADVDGVESAGLF